MTILETIQAAGPVGQTVSEIQTTLRAANGGRGPSKWYVTELVNRHVMHNRIVALAEKRHGETVYVARGGGK